MDFDKELSDGKETIDPDSFIAELQRYQSLIPDYTQLTELEIMSMRRASTLPPAWLDMAITAVGASTTVEMAIGATHDALRSEVANVYRWQGVEQELRVLLKGVAAANLVRRHRIGIKALQAYGICRQLVRRPEHMHLIHFVEQMKQMNKLGKRKPKEKRTD